MMKPMDHRHRHYDDDDDDVQTVDTVKSPNNDPPGDYFFPVDRDDDDNDEDGLASLSTMDTYTFRRLRDRRGQHTTNKYRIHHYNHNHRGNGSRRSMDAAERGFNTNSHRIDNNDDGTSSLFSLSSSTTRLRGVLGWHHDNNNDRRVNGNQTQQRWSPLFSSSSATTATTTANSSSTFVLPLSSSSLTRKNGVCGSHRFVSNGRRDYLSWQHVVLYLGMMGFSLVMWTTGSEILTTIMYNEKSSNDIIYREIGLETKNMETENFDGGTNVDTMENRTVEKNSMTINDVDGQEEDSQQAQLSLQHVAQEGGVATGDQQLQQTGQQSQIQSQQQPQIDEMIHAPSPPSISSVSASLSAINKTLEPNSALSISNIQQQAQSGIVVKGVAEGGGVIVANSNNTSVYYDGVADDNPRLWGVKE